LPDALIWAIFFFTFGSAITMTFVLSNPIPQIAKVPAILEFLGKLRHAFLAVVFDKIFSFFKIRASSFDNNANGGFL